MKSTRAIRQSGAVSLFVVVFAILLMSVVTISFLRIMTNDQQQAANNDLSQSAYDSALGGVEDAKRALVKYKQTCEDTPGDCSSWTSNIASTTCNTGIVYSGVVGSGVGSSEVKIQQSSGDQALDQAYTCVTMQLDTDDYVLDLSPSASGLIPLITDAGDSFTKVRVEWFSKDDVSNDAGDVEVGTVGATKPLPQLTATANDWDADTPPIMRTQFMQIPSGDVTLSDFDVTEGASSNTNTLFLYPSTNGSSTVTMTNRDIRQAKGSPSAQPADGAADTPYLTRCAQTVNSGSYACSMTITVPTPIGSADRGIAFLRLTSFYNQASVRVTMLDAANSIVQFHEVQPIVDSTGRANTVFRRVSARVNLYDTSFPYPEAAVDVTSSFCKDFGVTDTEYIAGSCTP
tara:strand:+ start:1343 stop:2548 length:1206 start_codon:yes stop_codon:yes gene_type:complete